MAARRRRRIVGRGLCLYRCADFANVPRNKRRAALALNIPLWSPFARTGHHAVWAGGAAMVWLWNADQVGVSSAGNDEANPLGGPLGGPLGELLPETVFHPKKADGVHLQACHHGFELQLWDAGVLRDSYWSPQQPTKSIEDWFAARANAPVAPAQLAALAADIGVEPWATPVTPGEWLRLRERPLVACGLALFAVVACWQETRIWKTSHESAAAAAEVERLEEELAPVLDARNEVRKLRARRAALAALLFGPSQPELMILTDGALPADVALREWRYQGGRLNLALTGPALDPVACVDGLSAVFDGVVLGGRQRPGRVDIVLKVRPPAGAQSAS